MDKAEANNAIMGQLVAIKEEIDLRTAIRKDNGGKGPSRDALRKERDALDAIWSVLATLPDDYVVPKTAADYITKHTTPLAERQIGGGGKLVIHEGDALVDVMSAHPAMKFKKLIERAAECGLKLEGTTFVAA